MTDVFFCYNRNVEHCMFTLQKKKKENVKHRFFVFHACEIYKEKKKEKKPRKFY
jgi:hypothetical protein